MLTTCPPKFRCHTAATGWLNRGHPKVEDGVVYGQVCFHYRSKCCYWSTYTKLRNCGTYYVYYFKGTPACNLRYCSNGMGKFNLPSSFLSFCFFLVQCFRYPTRRLKINTNIYIYIYNIYIYIIITLFKSQIILAKRKCSTNWGDCKSNQPNQINQIKSNQHHQPFPGSRLFLYRNLLVAQSLFSIVQL